MKAISLWQIWASLCVTRLPRSRFAIKHFETRSWPLPGSMIGQQVLIHAAKKWNPELREHFARLRASHFEIYSLIPEQPPLGAILGAVTFRASHATESIRDHLSPLELAVGDFGDGRFAWEMENSILFDKPIPYRGRQGFFNVPEMEGIIKLSTLQSALPTP